jgi:hypothetical protein
MPKDRRRKKIGHKQTGKGVAVLPQTVFPGPFKERNHRLYEEIKRTEGLSIVRRHRESTTSSSDHSVCSLESAGNKIPTAQQLVITKLRNELDELKITNQQLEHQRLALFDTMDQHLATARQRIQVRLHQEKAKQHTVDSLLKQHRKQILHKWTS